MIYIMLAVCYSSVNAQTRSLRVVYTDWYPYTYVQNGQPYGFEIDIFRAVMKQMNITVTFSNFPWKRCLESVKNGTADVVISALKTQEREEFLLYPDTNISISRTVFFLKKTTKLSYSGSYEQLKGYSIGVIMGFTYGEDFDKAGYLQKDEAVDAKTLLTKLINGRNDLIAENEAVVTALAKDMGVLKQIKHLEPPIHAQKLYAAFSKANGLEEICSAFSKQLRHFKTTKEYKAILAKYGLTIGDMSAGL